MEVSWRTPSGGSDIITGYRIFYDREDNNILVPSLVTSIGLAMNDDVVGWTISIHSEADELLSELINVTITGEKIINDT